MKTKAIAFLVLLGLTSCAPEKSAPVSQQEIVHRTQELMDAYAPGNKTPFQKYFADDVTFFDEQGHNMDKTALVASIEPLPAGSSGRIEVANSKFNPVGNTAIHSYDMNETEFVQGQEMHARYHETDTWMYRNGQWQIVAGQVLRYYEDPAAGQADVRKYKEYSGTYQLGDDRAQVSVEDGKLYFARGTRPKVELIPEACDIFFRKGVEGRMLFHFASGKVDSMISRRNNEDIAWKKVG